jgi:hypothetical protein
MVMKIHNMFFSVMTPCSLVGGYQHFREACCVLQKHPPDVTLVVYSPLPSLPIITLWLVRVYWRSPARLFAEILIIFTQVLVVFLSPTTHIPGQYHYRFFLNRFQFIMNYHFTTRR